MKLKIIKSEKQLKAGAYIRACVNCHGNFWLEYLDLAGKPFSVASATILGRSTSSRKMSFRKTGFKSHFRFTKEMYVGDLLGDFGMYNTTPTVLVPFSNKAWNFLSQFKDVRSFMNGMTGRSITDDTFSVVQNEWEWMRQYDDALAKSFQDVDD